MVSLLCAACLGLLSYILATGRVPQALGGPSALDQAKAAAVAPERPLDVSPAERVELEKLLQSLRDEQEQYARRKSELEASMNVERLRDQLDVLAKLKSDVEAVQSRLDADIRAMEDTERKNLQTLAEVYAKVEAEKAAQILLQMDRRRAAMILSLMQDRAAAGVLDAVSGMGDESIKIAVEWSDIIRKIKSEENARKGKAAP
jgi:flagellar motility protein MotE (MotC chaperone)